MGIAVESTETAIVIVLEDVVDISSAAELKAALVDGMQANKSVEVSVARASYLDVTAAQLLWAGERAAKGLGLRFAFIDEVASTVWNDLHEAGLDLFPIPIS